MASNRETIAMLVFWIVFHVVIIALLVLDLWVLNRGSHEISTRQALTWTAVWILLACAFAVGIYFWQGSGQAMSFAAGYLIELSLSVDNLFVFLALFASFLVPRAYQPKVLVWGIVGAVVMRAGFIVAGASLIRQFAWLTYLFGGFLVYLGIRFAMHPQQHQASLQESRILRLVRRILPFTSEYEGDRFLARQNSGWAGTPLLLVLITIEVTDVLFALDSIPAVLAISQDPFIVYTSNVFAILGLRSLYFALARVMDLFHYLSYGLAAILMFTGAKMLLGSVYHIPVEVALGVVAGILILSVLVSLLRRKTSPPKSAGRKRSFKTIILLLTAWVCILGGALGLILPLVPGTVLLFAGVMILARQYTWARKLLARVRRMFPSLRRVHR